METIVRNRGMLIINTGNPFSLEFVTADRRRGTGGELIKVDKWKKVMREATSDKPQEANAATLRQAQGDTLASKNPRHLDHDTFNIFDRSTDPDIHEGALLAHDIL